jgi:hypothetical protein
MQQPPFMASHHQAASSCSLVDHMRLQPVDGLVVMQADDVTVGVPA